MVVAHSANVTSTVLQNVHRCDLVVTWLVLAWPMSTVWKTLIVQPQISNFWEESLLGAHRKLLMSEQSILLYLRLVFQTCRVISLSLVLCRRSVIPLRGVTFAGASAYEKSILLLLLSALRRHWMVVLLVVNPTILLYRVGLHIWYCPMRIWAVTVALTPIRVVTELLLL